MSHDIEMEREGKNQKAPCRTPEPDFLLQWGNRKRLRCIKVRDGGGINGNGGAVDRSDGGRRRITSRVNRRVIKSDKDSPSSSSPPPLLRHPSNPLLRRSPSSPEKDEGGRFYTTRGSVAAGHEENGNGTAAEGGGGGGGGGGSGGGGGGEEKGGGGGKGVMVLPRFFVSLSSKEKEEDFMAMKGCKLPQRPKKRAKLIQKTILLVSPGAWLSDLSQERYEVREKKGSRKRRRGLKAMCMESDSD